jgi:hypothetical protein
VSEHVWVTLPGTKMEYRINFLSTGRQIHTVRIDGILVASDTQPIIVVEGKA